MGKWLCCHNIIRWKLPAGDQDDVFVEEIEVQEGGIGYTEDDTIEDFEICGLDENGTITKVCTNDKAYRTLPDLEIKH